MGKILYIATSDIHLNSFHRPYIQWFVEQGYEIDLVFDRRGDFKFPGIGQEYLLNFPRKLSLIKIFRIYNQMRGIIEKEHFDLIHCHTPIPSFITRLAARKARKKGCKVLYTAHGFHFYKGGPLINWLLYYPAEYFASLLTDAIIVLNKEDFGYINGKMLHKESFLISGIGVEIAKFRTKDNPEMQTTFRTSLGLLDKDIVLLYIGEFIPRKNHEFLIRCVPELIKINPNVKLLFAGSGILLENMMKLARELEILDRIYFLGFRMDIEEVIRVADIGISVSKHEGLGLGLIEQMAHGLPVVASMDRGHKESIINGVTGYTYRQNDRNEFVAKVTELINKPQLRKKMGQKSQVNVRKFDLEFSLQSMASIYKKYLP